jgi:hypothetical protein
VLFFTRFESSLAVETYSRICLNQECEEHGARYFEVI